MRTVDGVGRGGRGGRRGGQGERRMTHSVSKSFPRLLGRNRRRDWWLFGVSPDDPIPACIGLRGARSWTGEELWGVGGLGCATRRAERQLRGHRRSFSPSFWAHWWSPILSWRTLVSTDLGGATVA